jgi:Met-zincin/Domain of unknown function (DUF5117)
MFHQIESKYPRAHAKTMLKMGTRSRMRVIMVLAVLVATPMVFYNICAAQSITEFVAKLTKTDSFLTVYINPQDGTIFLEIPENGGPDLLYQSILTSGFGSRDLTAPNNDSLDRGRFGQGVLVAFRRFGKRVLLIERNTNYYTPSSVLDSSNDAGLSFPNSVIGSFDVKATDGSSLIIDASNFFLKDGVDIPSILKVSGQGTYTLQEQRSAIDVSHIHVTRGSIGVDALLTFSTSGDPPDRDIISRVAAERSAILVRERNALVRLPEITPSFRPRIFDPRSGFFDNTYQDPAFLPNGPTRQSFIARHALSKKNPGEKVSEPVNPIIYYIDSAVPQDLHPLIAEAASWWDSAFEAAGFKNAIQVKELSELPPENDRFDIGVNIILSVPRETRGYSLGGMTWDPRTGQILKAIVRLDAMRMQADRLLLDAITSPYREHPDFTAREEALRQRFRLLVAHELGHSLGLKHQFIASAQGMSSVMDYPAPNIFLGSPLDPNGVPVLRDVFPQTVGAWDKAAIFYGYHPFLPDEEGASLNALVETNERAGLYWMTDEDTGDGNPLVHKWDRGTDPVAELENVLALRHAALGRFSTYAIPNDKPLAVLQDALAALYLLHQFEVKAVGSMLAGFIYRYSMRDGEPPMPVPASRQRQALQALLTTLATSTLWPDQRVLHLMSPRPPTYPASDESFSGDTGQIFDALRPVEDAASLTMAEILKPTRAVRLAKAKAYDPNALGIDEVLAEVVAYTWKSNREQGSAGAAQRAIALTILRSLLTCATSKDSAIEVRGACWVALDDIVKWTGAHSPAPDWFDAYAFATHAISAAERAAGAFELPKRRALVLDPM